MSELLELTQALVACPSVTPEDAGCQKLLIERLQNIGFHIEPMRFGQVDNFWARRGNQGPLIAFIGHTDVVPTGPTEQWTSPPFKPTVRDGYLYGRGTADMKANIAAMIIACEKFIASHPHHQGSIAFLITSDEEGPSIDGTAKVINVLQQRGELIDYCLVGEPSSKKLVGDQIKNGRRGTLSGELTVMGIQGHIAYPHLARNPIHQVIPALQELTTKHWDQGNAFFQPTSFQLSNIQAGTGAGNVIPGTLNLKFNFRYSPEVTAEQLQAQVQTILDKHALEYELQWHHSGKPFLTTPGKLVDACIAAVQKVNHVTPTLSTDGGTSDGRFVAEMGAEIVELGLCNASIHQIDECVKITDLYILATIYENILQQLIL